MNFHHTILIRTNIPNGNRKMLGCGETLSLFISRQVQNFSAVHRQVSPSEKFSQTAKIVVAHLEGKRSNEKFIDSLYKRKFGSFENSRIQEKK